MITKEAEVLVDILNSPLARAVERPCRSTSDDEAAFGRIQKGLGDQDGEQTTVQDARTAR
jgi:hypothetical protein